MEYLERMKAIQNAILNFLDDENEQNYEELVKLFDYQKTQNDVHELKSILHLICKIVQNHHRGSIFFEKIKKVLDNLKTEIKQTFSNLEIFNIFNENKRALLLLIDEDIITINDSIAEKMVNYGDYFYPEIQNFYQNTGKDFQTKELPENFEEKRRIGENDLHVCELIRNDDVENFIINFNKNEFSLTMKISPSIFETNSFLINKNPTLIEYTLFFGSIQILQFLFQNNIEIKSSSWIYAIHSKNPEIIHFLEEKNILPIDRTYNECFLESIKCHHNDFALYFKENLLIKEESNENNNDAKTDDDDNDNDCLIYLYDEAQFGFRFYNFFFIPEDTKEPIYFFYAVDYDYYKLVDFYINIKGLDINKFIVFKFLL